MDLEQCKSWLSLAQQPYPLVNKFLLQLNSAGCEHEAEALINPWLKHHQCSVDHRHIENTLLWLQQPGHHLLSYPEFSEQLKAINSPPPILFLAGNPDLLFSPQLAIVGSRKPSNGGCENAVYFARDLAEAGLTLVSGLAKGIDALAHQSALAVQGKTTAVLGCGHHHCYPQQHQRLFEQIKEQGLIISEFTPDTPVRPQQFPRRNRIISGLSLGVLVVEAAIRSGSLITARLAAEQGRDVFAIPGDITNPMTRGCHHLIRHGACLVEHPEQILQELELTATVDKQQKPDTATKASTAKVRQLSKDENKLMQCINRHPTPIDHIVNRSEMKMQRVLSLLFNLELKNRITASADGYFKAHT